MASRIPELPRDSHVQSHAAGHKNKLCDSHAALGAREIAGGWTRPQPAVHQRQLSGTAICQSTGGRISPLHPSMLGPKGNFPPTRENRAR